MFVSSDNQDYQIRVEPVARDDYRSLKTIWESQHGRLAHSSAPATLVDESVKRVIWLFKLYKNSTLVAYFPFEVKSFLGLRIIVPAYSELTLDFIDIACEPSLEGECAQIFLEWLKEQKNCIAYLFMLDENRDLVKRAVRDPSMEVEARGKYFYTDLPSSKEEFFNSLSPSTKKSFKRQLKRFEGEMYLEIVEKNLLCDELETAISDLVLLHSELFPVGSAMLPHLEDLKPWLRKAFSDGAAFLVRTREIRTGEVVASELMIKTDTVIGLMQSGRKVDERYSGIGSWQLNSLVLWAIENGKTKFEYLFGDQEYKRRLSSGEKNAVSITYFSSTWAKFVFKIRRRLGKYFSFLR